ncbi:hypothetical protein GcM1_129003, partial [Golovinomyces cichoracearum]
TFDVDELIKGGTVNLRLRQNPAATQGTCNAFVERKSRGRPRKEVNTTVQLHIPENIPSAKSVPEEELKAPDIIRDKVEDVTEPRSDVAIMNIDPHRDLRVQETEIPASPLVQPDTSFESNIQ